ncbi:MAG: hypothetical protein ISR96_05595 [Nitrospira sp.]|nr:hypothetical protein [bacterium]MBL7048972.1 hypothetical protein [Nitrospira sp.]
MKRKPKKKKGQLLKILEYVTISALVYMTRITPLPIVKFISNTAGNLLYFISSRRRNIAINNLTHAFRYEMSAKKIRRLARSSCQAFFFTFLEAIKMRYVFARHDAFETLRQTTDNLEELYDKAKQYHQKYGACIFVTPHIGNWEMLPMVCSHIEIPLAVVARPLDNEYLEKLLFANRISEGQVLIPKTNAMFVLQKTLKRGISIGMLPDQSTAKGVLIDFFKRQATTTPVPAILAINYNKPVIVVACCRKPGSYKYEGFISEPILPGNYTSEKDEIIRITTAITKEMEKIIRKYPNQYLWIHNRWKTYKGRKAVMS